MAYIDYLQEKFVPANDMPVRGQLKDPVGIAFHWTGTKDLNQAVNTNKSGEQFGYQYLIDKDGTIRQNVPEGSATWHILPSKDTKYHNANMFGISMVGQDDKNATPEQLEAAKQLSTYLKKRYDLKEENYLGHGQLNPGHRQAAEGMRTINYVLGKNEGNDMAKVNPQDAIESAILGQTPQVENRGNSVEQAIVGANQPSWLQNYQSPDEMQQSFIDKSKGNFGSIPSYNNLTQATNLFGSGGPFGAYTQQNVLPKEASKFVAKDLAAKFDSTIGGLLPFGIKNASYAFGRLIGDDEKTATAISDKLTSYFDKPIGRAFGISDDPAYKGEALGKMMGFIGENIHKGSQAVADTSVAKAIGLTPGDIDFFANMVLPKVTELGVKGAKLGTEKVGGAIEQVKQEFNPPEKIRTETAQQRIEQMLADFEEKKNVPLENIPVENKPSVEFFNPETQQPVAQPTALRTIEVPQEEPVNRAETQPFKPEEIQSRSDLLNRVGIENQRESALNANPKEASSQYITSKAEQGIYGQGMTEQINYEKNALNNHFVSVEQELGGVVPRRGTISEKADAISEGRNIKSGFENAVEAHNTETKRLYKEADDFHGNKPVDMSDFKGFLDRKSNFPKAEGKQLRKDILQHLKDEELLNPDGSIREMTVKQSENLRQFVNEQYDYKTQNTVGNIKQAIDKDVFKGVEGKTYEDARAHFAKGKEIYDNPKVIKNLLSDEGTNQKISDEKVVDKLVSNSTDEAQFSHLIDVLRETNQTQALNQIQTSLVNRIKEAGQSSVNEPWNSIAAAKQYSQLGNKLTNAFADNPEALAKIADGIEAGNIVHIPNKYPGAAVQSHLMNNKFADIALRKGGQIVGAGTGGFFFGPLGGVAGSMGGEALGVKGSEAFGRSKQAKQLEKEIKYKNKPENKISDFNLKP